MDYLYIIILKIQNLKNILLYVPIEIDLINNDIIINNNEMINIFIKWLIYSKLPISLINECDGIWNISGCLCTSSPHYSLLFQYCYIINLNIISVDDLYNVINNGKFY